MTNPRHFDRSLLFEPRPTGKLNDRQWCSLVAEPLEAKGHLDQSSLLSFGLAGKLNVRVTPYKEASQP